MKAYLLLEDGTKLEGISFGAERTIMGEIVFNTGMTGYQEILTDPSYAGQVVVMTYPLIGNYGINEEDFESKKVQVSGFIVKEYAEIPSHWQSQKSISEYLKENGIIGISNLDTRMITKKIRSKGTMNCLITTEEVTESLWNQLKGYRFPRDIVQQVSIEKKYKLIGEGKKIGVMDLGVKQGIIHQLQQLGCDVTVYPWNASSDEILQEGIDALLFSNGPGDPKDAEKVIQTAKNLKGKLPLFGICLGHQILALAMGADTYKLKFGHRGSNHPVQHLLTNKVFISSQNHGYAVKEESIPGDMEMEVTFQNINDHTIEGFACEKYGIQTVQFHPEEGPGPEDTHVIIRDWIDSIKEGDSNA